MTAASAVLRVGCHAPVPLHGTPAVSPAWHPGEVTIVLGHTAPATYRPFSCGNLLPCGGQPVTITIGGIEWTEDLEDAARVAWAGGIIQAGMVAVPR